MQAADSERRVTTAKKLCSFFALVVLARPKSKYLKKLIRKEEEFCCYKEITIRRCIKRNSLDSEHYYKSDQIASREHCDIDTIYTLKKTWSHICLKQKWQSLGHRIVPANQNTYLSIWAKLFCREWVKFKASHHLLPKGQFLPFRRSWTIQS